jgi:mycothiol synthase
MRARGHRGRRGAGNAANVASVTEFRWDDGAEPAGVRDLLLAAQAVDGRPSVSVDGALPGEFRGGSHLLALDGGQLVGYAHLDQAGDAFGHQVAELLVRPEARGHGLGSELLDRLLERAGVAPGTDTLRIWAHGDAPAAARLADKHGLTRARELLRLHLALTNDLPEARLPDGISLRSFVPGQDEAAVIAVNHAAFSWHPEQGALSVEDLRATEGESWFDPAGFLLAVNAEDTVLGFHWTKVHPDVDGGPMGEVYVVGVDPAAQGGGLGRALTLAGLRHLGGRGLSRVMLYVEADNPAALAVYTRIGFTRWDADVQYAA